MAMDTLQANQYWPTFNVYIDNLNLQVKYSGHLQFIDKIKEYFTQEIPKLNENLNKATGVNISDEKKVVASFDNQIHILNTRQTNLGYGGKLNDSKAGSDNRILTLEDHKLKTKEDIQKKDLSFSPIIDEGAINDDLVLVDQNLEATNENISSFNATPNLNILNKMYGSKRDTGKSWTNVKSSGRKSFT